MGSAFSSAGRVKAPAMRRDAAMASATSLGWVLSPAVKPAARARISSSVIEMVAPILRRIPCRKSRVSGTLPAVPFLLQLSLFLQHFFRHAQRINRGGKAAIGNGMGEDLGNLLSGAAIIQRRDQMNA